MNGKSYPYIISLPAIIYGYDLGCSGGILFLMHKRWNFSHTQSWLIVSSMLIGVLVSIMHVRSLKKIRHKSLSITATVFYIFACLIMLVAHNPNIYIVGKIISGYAIGLIMESTPSLLATISSRTDKKVSNLAGFQLWISIGFTLAALMIDLNFSTQQWRVIILAGILPAILYIVSILTLQNAHTISIRSSQESSENIKSNKRLVFSLSIMQQLTGIGIVVLFTPEIVKMFTQDKQTSLHISTIIAFGGILSGIIASSLIPKIGIIKTLILGSLSMSVGLFFITLSLIIHHKILGITGVFIILLLFPATWGPAYWVIMHTLLPDQERNYREHTTAIGLNTFTSFLMTGIFLKDYPVVVFIIEILINLLMIPFIFFARKTFSFR